MMRSGMGSKIVRRREGKKKDKRRWDGRQYKKEKGKKNDEKWDERQNSQKGRKREGREEMGWMARLREKGKE